MRFSHLSFVALFASLATGCIFVGPTDDGAPAPPTEIPETPDEPDPEPKVEIATVTLIGITPHQDFAQSGLVDIALLPKDTSDEAVIDATLAIDVTTDLPSVSVSNEGVTEKQPNPNLDLTAAINIDSSGSMGLNDPNLLRQDAAKQFVDQLGDADQVMVSDFGAGATDPFSDTRLLTDFTSNKADAYAAIDMVAATGGTPMLRSIVEVLDFYNLAFPAAGDENRSLLVLGDGQPNGGGTVEDACAKAQDTSIPINTIGFGPAADKSPQANESAVKTLRDLADCSAGAYTGVVDAAALGTAFEGFGEAARSGSITITVRFDPVPATDTTVGGTLAIGNGEQAPVEIQYEFVAP